MSYQDMKTYWAWRGEPLEKEVNGKKVKYVPPTPTVKKLDYATNRLGYSLCIGVWDDDKYTPLHRDELSSCMTQYTFDPNDKMAILVKLPGVKE